MRSYVIEFVDGRTSEGYFASDREAICWAESVLKSNGCDVGNIASEHWEEDGENEDGEQCYRTLFWADEEGEARPIAALCKVG